MTDAKHTAVVGPSGEGKTTYCRKAQATADSCSLFLSPKAHESNVSGKRVRGRKALNSAVKRATKPSDVRCKWLGASYPAATQTAREWAHDIREHRGWSTQIIVDEAQQTPLSNSEGALKAGLHEDRDRGIKWMLATQSPQDLKEDRGYKGVNQCPFIVWVGTSRMFQGGFIDYYGLEQAETPDGRVVGLPDGQYKYHVIRPTRPPKVVYQGETDPRYG